MNGSVQVCSTVEKFLVEHGVVQAYWEAVEMRNREWVTVLLILMRVEAAGSIVESDQAK